MDALLPHNWPPQTKDAVVGVALGATAIVVAPVALSALGFGSAGIVAGSTAAALMGPATAAGGVFATLQAAGMGGLGVAGMVGLGGGIAAANVVGGALIPGRNGADFGGGGGNGGPN